MKEVLKVLEEIKKELQDIRSILEPKNLNNELLSLYYSAEKAAKENNCD